MSLTRLPENAVFLMDGSAYVYRGFFANRNLARDDGFPTGSLVTVTRTILRILRRERPRWFCFVHDGRGKNFRHEIYPQYKANREAMPEELVCQIEPIRSMVQALGVRLEVSSGCEADDVIASLASRLSGEHPVVIVSADKDLKQCLGPNVYMWDPGAKDERLVTAELVREESGVDVAIWADMQALTGDSVDNIPGVPGIGPKTAAQIFAICPGLEAIKEHFSLLPPKFQKKLDGHLQDMFLWRQLTGLSTSQVPEVGLADLEVQPVDRERALALALEYQMSQLAREIDLLSSQQARQVQQRTPAPSELPWDVDPGVPGPERDDAEKAPAKSKEAREQEAAPAAPKGASGPSGQPATAEQSGQAGQAGQAALSRKAQPSLFSAISGGSLLDMMPKDPAADLEALSSLAALPACDKARVALVRLDASLTAKSGIAVAVARDGECPAFSGKGAREFLWRGKESELAGWARASSCIVLPDAKSLMQRFPEWRDELAQRALNGSGLFDLGLAAYLFDPEDGRYDWQRLQAQARNADPAGAELGPAALALGLHERDLARLAKDGLAVLYRDLELPLVPVLAGMEANGVAVDMNAFLAFRDEVKLELTEVEASCYAAAGTAFNLRSSRQLGEVLFGRLGLPQAKKTKGGQASTSQEVLESLAGKHPVVDAILRYRRLEKLRSTYLEPLPGLTDAQGRLHTTFNQEATATGRLSSSNPNLQNIPVRGALGKRMRSCFVGGEGRMLVSCDYSQIELRVLAHVSEDKELIDAFCRGEDIHARTAALIYDCPPEEVSPDRRRGAKTINFGLIYGMGAQKLARELGLTINDAKGFIQRYFEKLTGLRSFYANVEAAAKADGFVTTLGGRRRLVPGITSKNGQVFALAKRQAINTVIQGSAADIIKMAMLAAWKDGELQAMGARMVLQVHDELVFEVPREAADACGRRVAALMEAVQPGEVPFRVPLVADWGAAPDWGGAH